MTAYLDSDICDLQTVQRIGALLDRDPGQWSAGDILPRGWHFAFFLAAAPGAVLGVDGLAPPEAAGVDLPAGARVMLGGRSATYHGDIRIGEPLRRERTLANVSTKAGSSGPLTILSWRHDIFGEGPSPVITETEDMIYRAPPTGSAAAAPAAPADPVASSAFRAAYAPGPRDLFRYSALTFNAHRIHYDLPYATGAEGYPGLVINGGLTALMLIELFRRETGRAPESTMTRNRGPLFCGAAASLNAEPCEEGWRLWAANAAETPAIEMTAR